MSEIVVCSQPVQLYRIAPIDDYPPSPSRLPLLSSIQREQDIANIQGNQERVPRLPTKFKGTAASRLGAGGGEASGANVVTFGVALALVGAGVLVGSAVWAQQRRKRQAKEAVLREFALARALEQREVRYRDDSRIHMLYVHQRAVYIQVYVLHAPPPP